MVDHHPGARIQELTAEIAAVRDSGARMVALGSRDARGTFDQLEVFMSRWRAIQVCLDEPGPFIYVAPRSTFRRAKLDGSS
ncbi:hypothetical protein [Pseudonocardia asaccharolytica]|uniref:Uncharacterized protein n=1 Tax=Pseudonocardia asaccharolytica DSM 44247 = NBRC 16224 TaxID=1123024 RepID=A0A511CWK0_9PSEU|nr:hypothetical protein [Pseudonocardia asaccharolytica]GEL16932.1 hypothetical protein PA7_07690 [Pseudonocardia asaccharolytica DSM 44247 = NBRC 16224]